MIMSFWEYIKKDTSGAIGRCHKQRAKAWLQQDRHALANHQIMNTNIARR